MFGNGGMNVLDIKCMFIILLLKFKKVIFVWTTFQTNHFEFCDI